MRVNPFHSMVPCRLHNPMVLVTCLHSLQFVIPIASHPYWTQMQMQISTKPSNSPSNSLGQLDRDAVLVHDYA
jgi:hypothetical protein